MSVVSIAPDPMKARILATLASVPDPEIPVVSIVDLGILRGVERTADGGYQAILTPTYTGCPATLVIERSVRAALDQAGLETVGVRSRLSPPWTTEWISESGREKLREYGIAPPERVSGRARLALIEAAATCPRCGSNRTVEVSRFGSTPCKALWRCESCLEPFDRFKCH